MADTGLAEHLDARGACGGGPDGHHAAGPAINAYYDAQMSLCIRDCVLLESFRTEGSERELTERVVLPAWQRALERFGVKPLIVALEPVSGPLDLYWYSYPAVVLPVVEAALNSTCHGGTAM